MKRRKIVAIVFLVVVFALGIVFVVHAVAAELVPAQPIAAQPIPLRSVPAEPVPIN